MTKKNDYLKRQFYMMSSLGLFYLIILALFAVPLFGVFVVLLIKGALDYQYLVIFAAVSAFLLFVILIFRVVKKRIRMFREDGIAACRDAASKAGGGKPVQVSVFNGLLTFTYGSSQTGLPGPDRAAPFLLPEAPRLPPTDVVTRIQALSEMKKEGLIGEDEFHILKKRLIQSVRGM